MDNSAKSIRIAVIGAGQMAQKVHLPLLKHLSDEGLCVLQVICDISTSVAELAKQAFGFREAAYNAAEVVARSDIDAVYLFGTAQMHFEYGRQALENGKHVFIEKPPAPTWQEALELSQLAKQNSLVAVVGFNRRFQSAINLSRDEAYKYSRPYSLEAVFHKAVGDQPVPFGASSWLMSNGLHSLDVLLYLAQELPIELYSAKNLVQGAAPQNFSALLVWENGLHATFACNNSSGERLERYVVCSNGVTRIIDNADILGSVVGGVSEGMQSFEAEHRSFFGQILGTNTDQRLAMIQGARTLRLVELMEQGFCGQIDWGPLLAERGETKLAVTPQLMRPTRGLTKGSILVLNPEAMQITLSDLAQRHNLVYAPNGVEKLSESQRQEVVAVIAGGGSGPVSALEVNSLPNLVVVGILGASLRKYSSEIFLAKGVPIISTASVYADTVAEFVVMQALAGLRKAVVSHEILRRGGWSFQHASMMLRMRQAFKDFLKRSPAKSLIYKIAPLAKGLPSSRPKEADAKDLRGARIGLIGYGQISTRVAKLFQGFGCQVQIYSEHMTKQQAEALGVELVDLAMAFSADVVSVHRGLSEATENSIGEHELALLRPGAVFINTARGAIVNEAALVARLRKGEVYACLDVFQHEPLPKQNPFRNLPNVFLTSHLSGATGTMLIRAAHSLADWVTTYLEGTYAGPELIVDPNRLKTMT